MNDSNYNITLDIKYDHQTLIDIPDIIRRTSEKWSNQTLTRVNESVVRLGIIEGEFHWHKHYNDDEFFFVIEGKLYIDFKDEDEVGLLTETNDKNYSRFKTIELNPSQGAAISKGVIHRTRAPERTVILMVENKDIKPVGD